LDWKSCADAAPAVASKATDAAAAMNLDETNMGLSPQNLL
jgi:hypothetical protein